MTKKHMRALIQLAANWGIKGVCIAGGGEPLTNPETVDLPSYISSLGLQPAIITNGSLIDDNFAREMMHCRWVGISVDAGTATTFSKVHNVSEETFHKVITNISRLTRIKALTKSTVDITYKFLLRPDNWEDITKACYVARDIGVTEFHVRPADLERPKLNPDNEPYYPVEAILDSFRRCHELERVGKFRVFTVYHKFRNDFRLLRQTRPCLASPLILKACADGNIYVCADHGMDPRFKLCSHFPEVSRITAIWGSDQHRKLLHSIDTGAECGRCTYGEYSRQIDELTLNCRDDDPMCLSFP